MFRRVAQQDDIFQSQNVAGVPVNQHGTRDNNVWKGPGNDHFLGALFRGPANTAEQDAYARLHTGNGGAQGVARMVLPGTEFTVDPASGRMVQTGANGEVRLLDSEYFADLAASEAESREYFKKLAEMLFVSDEVLLRLTGALFYRACIAGNDGGQAAPGMPAQLVNATCLPSILWFLPTQSVEYATGISKMMWLVRNHPAVRGMISTPGKGHGEVGPNTKATHARSGADALAQAIS